jgi:Bacterial TniB protein
MSDATFPEPTDSSQPSQLERINEICKPRWIDYPRARTITEALEFARRDGKPQFAVLHGPAYNGQNALAERLVRRAKRRVQHSRLESGPASGIESGIESGRASIPTRAAIVPANATVSKLFGQLYRDIGFGAPTRVSNEAQVGARLALQGTRTLILMHAWNLLKAPECGAMLGGLLNIRDRHGISIILVTTSDALPRLNENTAFQQLAEMHELPPWEFVPDYEDLLATLHAQMGLREASPALDAYGEEFDRRSALAILEHSQSVIGHIVKTIANAGEYAITSGTERIDREVLEAIGIKVRR